MMYTFLKDTSALSPICRKYGVSSLSLFGSYVRGEETSESDVDLHTEASLSPYFKDDALREKIVVYSGQQ